MAKPKKTNKKTAKFEIISSYFHLNDIYDLNFSDNNYGFSWEKFKKFVGDQWAEYFTTNCFFKFVPTARLTHKTWNCIAYDFFILCNFSDSSCQEVRRYENTHGDTTIADAINVCEYLNENFDIDLGPENEHGIKWNITKDGGSIVFPNKGRIDFIGYSNGNKIFGKAAAGSSFLCSRTDEIVMSEEKETLTEKQLTKRYERLTTSMFRSNRIKVSDKPIMDWSWTFIDTNILSPTYGKEVTRYFYKNFSISFTCNPYDKYHPFYKKYATPFLPLNETVVGALRKTGKVHYENQEEFSELGIFVLRFTLLQFWESLPNVSKKLILQMKKDNPAEYLTVFEGLEYSDDDATVFPYRRIVKKWVPYDLENFKNKKNKMYKFDFYSVGIDWATGPVDNTVFIPVGYKQFESTGHYCPYVLTEYVAKPNDFITEDEKIDWYIEQILIMHDNLENFDKTVFHYDDKCKTAIDVIKATLSRKYNIDINIKVAIKHESNINKEAGLVRRVIWKQNLMGSGYFYANANELPLLLECCEELRYSEVNSNLPDQRMMMDPVDALFYATYPYRNVIYVPKNHSNLRTIFISSF